MMAVVLLLIKFVPVDNAQPPRIYALPIVQINPAALMVAAVPAATAILIKFVQQESVLPPPAPIQI